MDIDIINGPVPMAPQAWNVRNQRGGMKRISKTYFAIVPFIIKGEGYYEIAWVPPGRGYQVVARGKGTITEEQVLKFLEARKTLRLR